MGVAMVPEAIFKKLEPMLLRMRGGLMIPVQVHIDNAEHVKTHVACDPKYIMKSLI